MCYIVYLFIYLVSLTVHVSVGVLIYPGATVILLHGNPSVRTAPVGWTVVSPSHTHTHTQTQTHTAGMERAVWQRSEEH